MPVARPAGRGPKGGEMETMNRREVIARGVEGFALAGPANRAIRTHDGSAVVWDLVIRLG